MSAEIDNALSNGIAGIDLNVSVLECTQILVFR